jgi:hypothetical protein
MTANALYKAKPPYVGLLDFRYTAGCVAECVLHQQSNRGELTYYVLLQKALPGLGLNLITARYYRSAYPPQGRRVEVKRPRRLFYCSWELAVIFLLPNSRRRFTPEEAPRPYLPQQERRGIFDAAGALRALLGARSFRGKDYRRIWRAAWPSKVPT